MFTCISVACIALTFKQGMGGQRFSQFLLNQHVLHAEADVVL